MQDPATLITLASVGIAGFGIVTATALKGWQEWLDVRRIELGGGRPPRAAGDRTRTDLTELRERVRRLEAIANGGEIQA